ncbi:hypothetical protein ACFYRC_37820 [Streptomyces sp. NPDC005279]|uniref:hypothetical protein n=1 Tax=Streptomyces sp. NPDC005279 TaxID=3364712 RepID=UPI0036841BAE
MSQSIVAAPLAPLTQDAVISVFNDLRAVEAGDVDAAAEFASEEPDQTGCSPTQPSECRPPGLVTEPSAAGP